MLGPVKPAMLALCLITGCKHLEVTSAEAALNRFCEHPSVASNLQSTPDQVQFCTGHFEVSEDGGEAWYIRAKPQYWRYSRGGFVLGLATYSVNKTTGKITVSSITD